MCIYELYFFLVISIIFYVVNLKNCTVFIKFKSAYF